MPKISKENFAQDSGIKLEQPPLSTHSCLRVSFSNAEIFKSKAKLILNPPMLKSVKQTFFFGWLFGYLED